MNRFSNLSCISLFIFSILFAAYAQSDEQQHKTSGEVKVSDARVQKLCKAMREGKGNDIHFPKLRREDIPALLEIGKSTQVLESFPRNALSSQYEPECREGIVAIWFVEGIRTGNRFPSLNALCLPESPIKGSWKEAAEKNHPQVLNAYEVWWKSSQSLSAEEANKIDPLAGTKLRWH